MIYSNTKWAERLNYLAAVEDGWLDGEGEAIRPEVLDKANELLTVVESSGLLLPALFPLIDDETDEGGISMEWCGFANTHSVSLQVNNSFKYWVFIHNRETQEVISLETDSYEKAKELLLTNLTRLEFVPSISKLRGEK